MGLIVEYNVALNLIEHLIDGHPTAHEFASAGEAYLDADTAAQASFPLSDSDILLESNRLASAHADTGSAAKATIRPQNQLGYRSLTLRVVAPLAVERTSLEEDRGADAGPIVDGEPLDVKDKTYFLFHLTPPSGQPD